MPSFKLRQVMDEHDPALDGFCEVYQSAFAEAPYFERFEPAWIRDQVWIPHIRSGMVVVASDEQGDIVGIACCHAADSEIEPRVRDFLVAQNGQLPFNPTTTVFMSELAVLREHRKHGVGSELVNFRMEWARHSGYNHYTMRTAEDGSNSQRIYERIGAKRVEGLVQSTEDEGIETASKARIYMWGKL